jgi:hypothetical protein
MKTPSFLMTAFFLLLPFACEAQTPVNSPLPAVPTTKILAIGSLGAPLTPEQRRTIMSREVPDTVGL